MNNPPPARDEFEQLDPGLARERTDLAWRRSAISFTALGGAILRADPAAGAAILAMGAAVFAVPASCAGPRQPNPGDRSSANRGCTCSSPP